jgi:glyoxylase-like metal-dependent hydrolase (beta-lactamase superfamily II)
MKLKIKLFFILVLLFVLMSPSLAQQREARPVEFLKISDNLYEIHGGSGANGGLYIGDNGVLVIDAKMNKESVDQVLAGIKKITDKPVKYLVNTHSDGDHVNGNRFFPKSVIIVAHKNCQKEFFHTRRDGSASTWSSAELVPFVPSVTFKDEMDIYLGTKKIELWYFGKGHTTGDIVVYFPEEKTAFLGDQIFIGRAQLIHSYKGGNSFAHVKTLAKMLTTLDAEKFCSGHANVIGREAVKKHIKEMVNLQDKVKDLKALGKNLAEIKAKFNENESRLIEAIYNEIK